MAVNSLGPFLFYRVDNVRGEHAPPEGIRERTEVVQRPGVNGSGVRLLGLGGEPFDMISQVDVISLGSGQQLYSLYRDAVGETPFELVWRGFDYDTFNTRFVVLDVQYRELTPLINLVGGLNGNQATGAWLQAQWTLLPVPIFTE